MKKIKKISVRISQEAYEELVDQYMYYKNKPYMTKLLYYQEIKTLSDYIRMAIQYSEL